jgi:hypothetical protein
LFGVKEKRAEAEQNKRGDEKIFELRGHNRRGVSETLRVLHAQMALRVRARNGTP